MWYLKIFVISILSIQLGCSQASDDSGSVGQTSPAILTVSPSSFDFGFTGAGNPTSHTFTLTNNGGFNASTFNHIGNSEPFSFKGNDFPGDGGDCPLLISAGLSCNIVIEFNPATQSTFTENMQIQFLDGTNFQVLSLNLQGNSGTPAIAPTSLLLIDPASSPSSDTTPMIRISGGDVASGRTVILYKDAACTDQVGSATAAGGSVDIPSLSLADGIYNFYATTTNSFNFTSPCSTATLSYEVDSTAPNPQTLITHLTTHNNSATSPAISWTISTSTDVASQKIGLTTNSSGGNNEAGWVNLNSTDSSYSFSSLSLNDCVDYYATLQAVDGVGLESIYAVSSTPFQVDANNPTTPAGLSLSGTPTLVKARTLNFSASTDACGISNYEIALGTSVSGAGQTDTMNWLDIGTPSGNYTLEKGVNGASFNFTAGSTYYISLRAKDSSGRYSAVATSVSFTVNSTFTLSLVDAFPDKLDLSWAAPVTSGITDYDIYYKLAADSSYTLFADGVSTATTVSLTGLTPSSNYEVYIMAKVGSVSVEYTNILAATTSDSLLAPTSLVLFDPAVSPGNDVSPTITVSGGDVLSGNTIKLYTDNTCSTEVGSVVASGSSADITVTPDLVTDGSYTFYANVTDPDSYVSACSTASVTYELDTEAPNPQTLITHALTHNDTATTPAISWTLSTSTDIASQNIGLSTSASGSNDIAGFESLPSTDTTYTFSGLSLNDCVDYYATLQAVDSAGLQSVYAVSPTPFQVDGNDPTLPSGLNLSGVPTLIKTPTLSFSNSTDACGIASYEIALGTTGTGAGQTDTMDWLDISDPSGSYTLESGIDSASFNLSPGGTYFVSLRAKDSSGRYSAVATSVSFTVNSTFTLSLVDAFPDKLDLSWTAPITSGITDYDIYYKLAADSSYTLFTDGVSTATTVSLTGLTPSSNYEVYIMAKVGSVSVEYTNILAATTSDSLLAPTSLVLFDPATSPSNDVSPTITVSGGDVLSGNTIKLYTDNTCSTEVGSVVASGSSADITVTPDLVTDGSYTFYANVTDPDSYVSACSSASLGYVLDTIKPGQPSSINTLTDWIDQGAISPLISWTLPSDPTPSSGLDSIEVGLSTNTIGGNDVIGWEELASTQLTHQFSGLSLNECVLYYPSMRSVDQAGNTSDISVSSGFRFDGTAPTATGSLTITSVGSLTSTKTLDWSALTLADSCGAVVEVHAAVGTTSGGTNIIPWTNLPVAVGTDTSYQFVDGVDGMSVSLAYGTNYYTSFKIIDEAGNESLVVVSAPWNLGISSLSEVDGQTDGIHSCVLGGTSFDCLVDNTTDGGGWLLVGRGREGWNWNDSGIGASGDVVIDLPGGGAGSPGTVGATTFTPKYWSSAIVNELLGNDSLAMSDVEIRLKRSTNATGSDYQDYRWNVDRASWSWLFDTTFSFASNITIDGVEYSGGNTRDFYASGNNATRIFTWGWSGHNYKKGFSYGSSVTFGANSPTNFGWENGSESHSIPYTEVYIRAYNPEAYSHPDGSMEQTCLGYLPGRAGEDGLYWVDTDGAGSNAKFVVYCDMTTDGGGWTIVNNITGADGEEPITSDVRNVSNAPFLTSNYNLTRSQKVQIANLSTNSIAIKHSGAWLRWDSPMFDSTLLTPGNFNTASVSITSSGGTTRSGQMGWSTSAISGGGDFGLVSTSFDFHNTSIYRMLNSGCANHYIYSYSRTATDSDAGYDVNTAFDASWPVTTGCSSPEGGLLQFYTGMK